MPAGYLTDKSPLIAFAEDGPTGASPKNRECYGFRDDLAYAHMLLRFLMNRFLRIIMICSFVFTSRAQEADAKKKQEEAGRMMRGMMLSAPVGEGKASEEFPRIYAVMMDWPVEEVVSTVYSTSAGAASLYTTTALNIVGGEAHEKIRTAAKEFVRAANGFFEESVPAKEFPYPAAGRMRFYFLTYEGVRVLDVDRVSTETGKNKYSALFVLGQTVFSELRVVVQKQK